MNFFSTSSTVPRKNLKKLDLSPAMDLIRKYFPDLSPQQQARFEKLLEILPLLNEKVNVISRKDISSLEEKHILHSLSIAKKFRFSDSDRVIDVGTGGGFPGIPLAVMFPDTHFTLVDSIGKKVRLVNELSRQLELSNVLAIRDRMENLKLKADFVVSRAVSAFHKLHSWTDPLILPGENNNMPRGLIALKGGDLSDELKEFENQVKIFPISAWFEEPFFSTKKIVYLKK
ncbi:MAG: 16S rRNA (guanine(527)-N(7))-methyltransferase RsmG [Bacteroidota bacterium]